MADDKSKRGSRGRERVAGEQDYEVAYFAKKYGFSADRARELIKQYGNDREKLEARTGRIKK